MGVVTDDFGLRALAGADLLANRPELRAVRQNSVLENAFLVLCPWLVLIASLERLPLEGRRVSIWSARLNAHKYLLRARDGLHVHRGEAIAGVESI
jgi:hypothetical protein